MKTHFNFEYEEGKGGITITKYYGSSENLTIPESIGGISVTHIGAYAFRYNQDIEIIYHEGKRLRVKCVDGSVMVIKTKRTKDDYVIYSCDYFLGTSNVYVAERGEFFAHGKTIKDAVSDVNFKYLQETLDIDDLVSNIKIKGTVNIEEYRLLTGACRAGVDNFLNGRDITELPIKEAIKLTEGQYGGSKLSGIFN